MDSIPFRRQSTCHPEGTLLYTCHSPYASVIYRVFLFAYAFDAGRNAWNVRLEAVTSIWFCGEPCRDTWIQDENVGSLIGRANAAVDRLSKIMDKRSTGQAAPPPEMEMPADITQETIDRAWAAAESASLSRTGLMELDTARFVLSAVIQRYIEDSAPTPARDAWSDLLQLQNNELAHTRGRPYMLASHLRIFAFVRRVAAALPALTPYLATAETVRAVLAREQGNVFGMYEMSTAGDSEMLGWSMYVSASYLTTVDCAPNVRKERLGRALRRAGEELCINYIDIEDSVAERRRQLSANWYFDCVCQRCERELGNP
ncbi:hypothetical protein B0H10DRAFT_2030935 [Mycena sp. CBHHK59/15]|nr:hypothetical protein B0H10DRAFT_2030935 [Mycena sp. CBHHK59/15]